MTTVNADRIAKLADWKARYPDRVASVERLVRRFMGAPARGADRTIAVNAEELLNAVFGIEPSETP